MSPPSVVARTASRARGTRGRYFSDWLMTCTVTGGGIMVILAIVLILAYLLYMVWPLFSGASSELRAEYATPASSHSSPFLLDIEEGAEVAGYYALDGETIFFRTRDGEVLSRVPPPASFPAPATALGRSSDGRFLLYGASSGQILVAERLWQVRYTRDGKRVDPVLQYPFGSDPLPVDAAMRPVRRVAFAVDETQAVLAAVVETQDNRHVLSIRHYRLESTLFDETMRRLVLQRSIERHLPFHGDFLLLSPRQRYVYVANRSGAAVQYAISGTSPPDAVIDYHLLEREDAQLTSMQFLLGGRSVLVGGDDGVIRQWLQISASGGGEPLRLRPHRRFEIRGRVVGMHAEQRRKGFVAFSDASWLGVYHATAGRRLLHEPLPRDATDAPISPLVGMAISPRSDALLLAAEDGTMQFYRIDNPHPEISWSTLWGRIWYEGYDKPEYIWQSSSASEDFEPKFSLVPIAFGTLKASFYAILLAVPIALLGAIYTAHFMSSGMRRFVKPIIEIMEALPTVILGFLAGLWLAPFVENNLLGMTLLLPCLLLMVLLCAVIATRLPPVLQKWLDRGWHAALLIPLVLVVIWASIALGRTLDTALFDRGFVAWLNVEWGVDYRQRNAAVIGVAMGFAVIPAIFSIAEDAVFGVPRHLSQGSLALGATPWQTLVRVVLLTASPGIFSAVLIGLGRVVGETMIVLMATGNTPVMDMNIFHGMRTLSANIAIELPEAEVNSTHFRVLYLAAVLLFFFTFLFNTAGEAVRQGLRRRYASL